jgi:hypothetical protein
MRAVMRRVIALEDTQHRADPASIRLATRMSATRPTSTFVSRTRAANVFRHNREEARCEFVPARRAASCDGAHAAENNLVEKDYYPTVLSDGRPLVSGSPIPASRRD